jgi:hypothetical protein
MVSEARTQIYPVKFFTVLTTHSKPWKNQNFPAATIHTKSEDMT